MRYFKLPLNSDLSQTSYRARKDTDDYIHIEYNEGFIGEDWEEITEETLIEVFGNNPFVDQPKPTTPEPSQLDRIESTLNLLTADTVSTSAVNEAITEGVNDV